MLNISKGVKMCEKVPKTSKGAKRYQKGAKSPANLLFSTFLIGLFCLTQNIPKGVKMCEKVPKGVKWC